VNLAHDGYPREREEIPRVSSVSGDGPWSLALSAVRSGEGGESCSPSSSIGPPRGSPSHMARLLRQPGDVEITLSNWGTA